MTSRTNKQSLGLRLSMVATLLAAVGGLLVAAPASAAPLPDPEFVSWNDPYTKSQCRFTPTSVNTSAGTMRGRLTTKTSWSGSVGFSSLAHVLAFCYLWDGDSVEAFVADEDDARATYASEVVTVPIPVESSYVVCAYAGWVLRNGTLGVSAFYHCST